MDNCPFCAAPGAYREAVDGCCYVCGMVLPDSSVEPAGVEPVTELTSVSEAPAASATPDAAPPTGAPTVVLDTPPAPVTMDDDAVEAPAIELIAPRKLSPQYAHRVTAAWQATKSPFKNPRETLNSSSSTSDPANLLIASRTVGSVDEQKRADYELTDVIGEGNMGTVWSARQASLDREVAVKIPKKSASGSTLGREQFIAEVVVTGQLDHPNIVPIYDLARDETGHLFYSMKRIEGRAWDECMHKPNRTRQDNLEVLMKVCDAIRFAHDRGVIHRDIKPQNIMVGKYGEVSVMDWGIALRLESDAPMSAVTKLSPAGTPAYMAPEMATANPGEIGPHTDVYLLGAVLFEIIVGEPPHPPPLDSHDRLVQQNASLLIAARNVITPASESGELIDIAYKSMATDIAKRYQTVEEFQDAIRQYLSHSESIALAERGQTHLANAAEMRNGVYEDYAKARFAFDEAIQLWPENARARAGLAQATLAYARKALQDGNYSLGISLLDKGNPEHAELLKKLTAAKRKAERNRFVAAASAVAAACFLVGGIVVSLFFANLQRLAKNEAELARKNEELQKTEAVKARDDEKKQRGIAEEATLQVKNLYGDLERNFQELEGAKKEIDEANKGLQDSNEQLELQIDATNLAKAKAEEASYRSEIGLAADEVQRNAFAAARHILEQQAANETQKGLRNWEWGHLMYSANASAIQRFQIKGAAPRVEAVALAPNQQWFAAGADDGGIHFWWRDDPKLSYRPLPSPANEHDGPISAMAISRDGTLLLTAGGSKVHFWNVPVGELGRRISQAEAPLRYSSRILSVALSPDAQSVLTSADDATAQLWSRNAPDKPRQVFKGHTSGAVWQARFSPDGQQIVTAGDDGTVRIWNAESGAELRKFEGHRGPVYAAEFSPDGNFVVSGGRDRQLLAWDLRSSGASGSRRDIILARLQNATESAQNGGLMRLGQHAAAIRSLAFSPQGDALFSASEDNSLGVWSVNQGLTSGRLNKSLRGHGGWVRSCAAAGKQVLSGSYDGQVFLWDWTKYEFPLVLRPESERSASDLRLTSAAASPDAKWIATAAENGAITMWNMHDPLNPTSQHLTEGHDWLATTGVYFDDGNRLLTAGGDNSAIVWDAQRGNQLLRIGGWNKPGGTGWRGVAAASHDGRWIATGSDDSEILAQIWDAESGERVAFLANPSVNQSSDSRSEWPEATAIAFAPDDKTLFVGDQWGTGYLFRTTNGSLQRSIRTFRAHGGKISAAAFLGDGRLVSAGADGDVVIWIANAQEAEVNFRRERVLTHRGRVIAIDISSERKQIVTATDLQDGKAVLRLWDAVTGKQIGTPQEIQRARVLSVALHPSQPRALVTEFEPATSTYRVGEWAPNNSAAVYRSIFERLGDTAMAVYARNREDAILTVGGRGARLRLANQVLTSYRPQNGVQSVSFSPDSRLLAAAGDGGSIKLWRFDDAAQRWMPDRRLPSEHQGAVNSVAFHPKRSDMILTAADDGAAKLWELSADDWRVVTTLGGGQKDPVNQAIFSPADGNGNVDVLTASDQGVKVWSLAGEVLREPHSGPAQCVAISPDRKWIVFGAGSEVGVWNRETQQSAPSLAGHSAEVTSLAFSPDGLRLFTASRDFHVKLWDAGDAIGQGSRELMTLAGHTDTVRSISLYGNPAHPSILSASEDGQAILWPSADWRD